MITKLVTDIRSRSRATLKQVQCLLGLLNFANFAIHRRWLHCRHLQRFCTTFRQRRWRSIPRAVDAELQCHDLHLRSPQEREITYFLTTDAAEDWMWGHLVQDWSLKKRCWLSRAGAYLHWGHIKLPSRDGLTGADITALTLEIHKIGTWEDFWQIFSSQRDLLTVPF